MAESGITFRALSPLGALRVAVSALSASAPEHFCCSPRLCVSAVNIAVFASEPFLADGYFGMSFGMSFGISSACGAPTFFSSTVKTSTLFGGMGRRPPSP